VIGWLVRVSIVVGIFGVIGFDVMSFTAGSLMVEDHAQQAASAAAESWESSHDPELSYWAAVRCAREARTGSVVDRASFQVSPDGVVTLSVRERVRTVIAHRIPPLRRRLEVVGDATVGFSP
jgi:hypothetical protein